MGGYISLTHLFMLNSQTQDYEGWRQKTRNITL